jgi:hypothetical protein
MVTIPPDFSGTLFAYRYDRGSLTGQEKKMSLKRFFISGLIFLLGLGGITAGEQSSSFLLDNLASLKSYQTKRISSYNLGGNNRDKMMILPGKTAEIARIEGAGIIKHIWITIACKDPMLRRNAVLRMYWDGETFPSVESPIGDFFGQGWGESYPLVSLPLAAAPKEGNAMNCFFPMPFSAGAVITLENQSAERIESFYFYVDYEQYETLPSGLGRFHAFWNRELTDPHPDGENEWSLFGAQQPNTDGAGNYVLADIEGKGHFVGVNYYVDNPSPIWYGEGDDMFFIDGEKWPPSLHGTGTEDFFNAAQCPKAVYMHPYFGYARVNDNIGWLGRTHCYRFLLESPISFTRSLKATIEHGHNNCLTLDLVSVAYWYQEEPHKPFPQLRGKMERQNMPAIEHIDIHRWRDAWRNSLGDKKLWGKELRKKDRR